MNQDWDIKPCNGSCGQCGTAFQDGQGYVSRLVVEQEGYERHDCCETCWAKPEVRGVSPHSAWKGVFRLPPPPPEEALKKETAESLLRKYMETEDPLKRNVIYVLAVMLERKRMLVERDNQVREDGTKIIVYEYRKTGEVFMVPDPGLRLDQLEQVQSEVAALLGIGRKKTGQPDGVQTEPPAAEQQAGTAS